MRFLEAYFCVFSRPSIIETCCVDNGSGRSSKKKGIRDGY
jgi:hypothetical protein